VESSKWKVLRAVESSKWNVERKDGKTRAKINAVESWSVGRLERKDGKTRAKINAVESSKLKVERKDRKTKDKDQSKNKKTKHFILDSKSVNMPKMDTKMSVPFWFLNQGLYQKNRNYVAGIEKIEEVPVQTHMYFPVFEY